MKRRKRWMYLLLAWILLLSACIPGGEDPLPPEAEEGVLIYASLNPVTSALQANVDSFNENHTDAQIEIRDYSYDGGPQRLLLELVAGRVPDIIDLHRHAMLTNKQGMTWEASYFGYNLDIRSMSPQNRTDMSAEYWMPYWQLVQRGYLENLWPYIEKDPDLGREAVMAAPLKAAEAHGGLYMLFREFSVSTMIGPESIVGDRIGWTMEDVMETLSTMPDGSTILQYNAVRSDVYHHLISPTLNRYVDWDAGRCSFDSEEFRNLLDFLKCFPEEFETNLSEEDVQDEAVSRILSGRQMLAPVTIPWLADIPYEDTYFGEPAAYVGYPTADGSFGSAFILHGSTLAMSSSCKNKEAAWDFMRRLILPRGWGQMKGSRQYEKARIPVNLKDYDMGNRVDMAAEGDYRLLPANGGQVRFWVDAPDETDLQRFEDLINNTTQIYWPDNEIADVVWDAAGPYFAGDKSLDDAIALIQNRVSLYVNEMK